MSPVYPMSSYTWCVLIALQFVCSLAHVATDHAPPPQFRWSNMFSDGMVLQQAPHRSSVWGFSTPADTIMVSLDNDTTKLIKAVADSTGRWKVMLPMFPSSLIETATITATSKQFGVNITITDVLFGEVWVCSGQSNMVRQVDWANSSVAEMKIAANYPMIRLFMADRVDGSPTPLPDFLNVSIPWIKPGVPYPTEAAVGQFAASCWYFGRDMYDGWDSDKKVPLGLVLSSWGGTQDEWWSSPDALAKCDTNANTNTTTNTDANTTTNTDASTDAVTFTSTLSQEDLSEVAPVASPTPPAHCVTGNCYNSGLWNSMIEPILGLSIKGVVWYQGESNSHDPLAYNCSFPAMIDDWRNKFHAANNETAADFPFGFVQLNVMGPPGVTPKGMLTNTHPFGVPGFAGLRWAQSASYGYAPNPAQPNTFMAVVLDTGEAQNTGMGNWSVHSIYKQPTGARLANAALFVAYNTGSQYFSGPVPSAATVSASGHVMIQFTGFDSGFEIRTTQGFEVFVDNKWQNTTIIKPSFALDSSQDEDEDEEEEEEEEQQQQQQQQPPQQQQQQQPQASNVETVALAGVWKHATMVRYLWRATPCTLLNCPIYSDGSYYKLPASPFWMDLSSV